MEHSCNLMHYLQWYGKCVGTASPPATCFFQLRKGKAALPSCNRIKRGAGNENVNAEALLITVSTPTSFVFPLSWRLSLHKTPSSSQTSVQAGLVHCRVAPCSPTPPGDHTPPNPVCWGCQRVEIMIQIFPKRYLSMYSGTSVLWLPSGHKFYGCIIEGGCITEVHNTLAIIMYIGTQQGGLTRERLAVIECQNYRGSTVIHSSMVNGCQRVECI